MLPGQSFSSTIEVKSPSGILVNADALPLFSVYRNSVLTSISVTAQNLSTGIYSYTFEVPANWLPEDNIDIHFSLSVDSHAVTSKKSQKVSLSASQIALEILDNQFAP